MKTQKLLLNYPAVFYEAEEGGYSVMVPDLPGCISEGDTLAEAIDMITDAIDSWITDEIEDGKEIPKASSFEEINKQYDSETVREIYIDIEW